MNRPWTAVGLVFLLVSAAGLGPPGAFGATPVLMKPGVGSSSYAVEESRNEVWMQPPNLDGLIMSSEIIVEFQLDTEIVQGTTITIGIQGRF